MRKLGIYGAGDLSYDVLDVARDINALNQTWSDIFFIDDTQQRGEHLGHPLMPFEHALASYPVNCTDIAIAIAEPTGRDTVYHKVRDAGYRRATLIHPSAYIAPNARIGEGCVLRPNCQIRVNAQIGANVHIQSETIVSHDCSVGESSHLALRVILNGHGTIGKRVYIGTNSLVREQITIGDDSIISMGAVVLKNVPPQTIAMGNPARIVKKGSSSKVFHSSKLQEK